MKKSPIMNLDKPVCPECGNPCNVIKMDYGIGQYEYHGNVEVDTQIVTESDCCGAPIKGEQS